MHNQSMVACLFIALGSLEGCVAATHEGDAGADGSQGSPGADARADAPGHPRPDAAAPDGGPVVEAGTRDEGGRSDSASPRDAAGDGDSAVQADGGAPADGGDASPPADSSPPLPVDSGPTCLPGQSVCGGACVDLLTDPNHCGDCATACPGVMSATPVCEAGACGFVCDSSYHDCAGVCANDQSPATCGTSCSPCVPPAHSAATCDGTSCGFMCDKGYHACSGACADETSVLSCGGSCVACPVPVHGTATCDGTKCGVTCDPGTVSCAGGTACCESTVISAGYGHTCAIVSGVVECGGLDTVGQLGDGATVSSVAPVTPSGLSGTVAVALGYEHSCALSSAGAVQCWGDNAAGDLGDSSIPSAYSDAPVSVDTLTSGVIAITAGYWHSCALLAAGTVSCWGYNLNGEIGNGTTGYSVGSPAAVSGLSGVVSIAAGWGHSCAVVSDGTVWCWGYNVDGQLGNGTTTDSDVPVQVSTSSGLAGAVAVVAGRFHTCALTSGGNVWCWGYGYNGELGSGGSASASVPSGIDPSKFGGASVVALSAPANGLHTCAIDSTGAVWCWGGNGHGQLGSGTTKDSYSPHDTGLFGATSIATGDYHSCAVTTTLGTLCWGRNDYGQLVDGTTSADVLAPINPSEL